MHGCCIEAIHSLTGCLCGEGGRLADVCLTLHFQPNLAAWASCAPDQASMLITAWMSMGVHRGPITLRLCIKKGVLASWPAGCAESCTQGPSCGQTGPNTDMCMGQWCHVCLAVQWCVAPRSIITYMAARVTSNLAKKPSMAGLVP